MSYRSRNEKARLDEAKRKCKQRKAICDKSVQFGPPDRVSNFQSSQKRKSPPKYDEGLDQSLAKKSIKVSDSIVEITPYQRSVFGKKVRMKFMTSSHDEQWFEGVFHTNLSLGNMESFYHTCTYM